LGRAIKEVRAIRKLTQKEVANRSGLTVNYLSLVETGDRGVAHDSLDKIAEALRIPTQFLVFLAGETPSGRGTDERIARLDRTTKDAILALLRAEANEVQPAR